MLGHHFGQAFAVGEERTNPLDIVLLAALGRRVVLADLVNLVGIDREISQIDVALGLLCLRIRIHDQDVLREDRLHVQTSLLEDRERTLHVIQEREDTDLLVAGKHWAALEHDRQERSVLFRGGRERLGENPLAVQMRSTEPIDQPFLDDGRLGFPIVVGTGERLEGEDSRLLGRVLCAEDLVVVVSHSEV